MRVISVTNQKGGVGKTTTAVNLAYYLAKKDLKTLLIDFDPQGSASSGLGLRNRVGGSYKLLDIDSKDTNSTEGVIFPTGATNLYIIPADQNLAAAEVELATITDREKKLRTALKIIEEKEKFDAVIIDCPPSLGFLTLNALVASTHMLIPVQSEFYALEGLSLLLETTAKVKNLWNPHLDIVGLLLTMYDRRNLFHREVEADIRKHFKSKLFDAIITRNIRLAEAASFGKAIGEYDKFSSGSKAYEDLATEVIERIWKNQTEKVKAD